MKLVGFPDLGGAGAGMTMKLAVNTLFAVQAAALGEVLGVLRGTGLREARAIEVINTLPVVGPAMQRVGGLMATHAFAPNFPLPLVAKDLGYFDGLAGETVLDSIAIELGRRAWTAPTVSSSQTPLDATSSLTMEMVTPERSAASPGVAAGIALDRPAAQPTVSCEQPVEGRRCGCAEDFGDTDIEDESAAMRFEQRHETWCSFWPSGMPSVGSGPPLRLLQAWRRVVTRPAGAPRSG